MKLPVGLARRPARIKRRGRPPPFQSIAQTRNASPSKSPITYTHRRAIPAQRRASTQFEARRFSPMEDAVLCGFYALTAPRNLPALSRIPQPQIARPGKRPHLRGNFLDSPRKLQICRFAGRVATDRILAVALRGLLIARCFHKSESNFICRMAPQVFGRS